MQRRDFIKKAMIASALPVAAVASKDEKIDDYKVQGNSHEPEFKVIDGKVVMNEGHSIVFSMCHGCTTKCGLRLHIDDKNDRVLRSVGNPFHPLANFHWMPYNTSINDALIATTRSGNDDQRATVCVRGAMLPEMLYSPIRILSPLKRVGKRGEGKWQTISFEQLIEEVVEGGNLFGEGHVDGLRAIYSDELIDPENPEYGTRRNQLLSFYLYDGRSDIVDRFMKKSFGTVNHYSHGGICGGGFRAGGKIAHNAGGFAHTKPDYEHSKFSIYWGTSPGNGGNPFQKQAKMVSYARSSDNGFTYAVIDPTVSNSIKYATSDKARWIGIKPGMDSALAMAMIRWIIENEKYATNYLIQPNLEQAKLAGEIHWCNATHLVITEKGHKDYGKFARVNDEWQVCSQSGKIQSYKVNEPAKLYYKGKIEIEGKKVAVKSSMQLLKESAFKHTMKEYSKLCGVSMDDILWLCDNFTKNGRQVSTNVHGGMMHTQAAMSTYAILCLNTLMGTYGYKGGNVNASAGTHKFMSGRYELEKFEGAYKPNGVNLSRSGKYYETSSEFKRKVAAGGTGYPAQQPWYPISMPLINETLTSHAVGYPYKAKIFINYMTNVIYGQAGLETAVKDSLKDSRDLPLFIGIDAFMNETNAYADYIVPDGLNLENWGMPNALWGTITKTSVVRYPAVTPRQDRDKNGTPIDVELFYITIAKKLELKGFGKGAFKDKDGNTMDLDTKEQFYAAALANLAFDGEAVSDISKEDAELSKIHRVMPKIEKYLKKEEVAKVAHVLAKGGRYDDYTTAYKGDKATVKVPAPNPASIYYEPLGGHRHSITGEYMPGTPTLMKPVASDGTPLEKFFPKSEWKYLVSSKKSNAQHYYTIMSDRMRSIHPVNFVRISEDIAKEQDIKTGDEVKIVTPYASAKGTAFVTNGVAKGVISLEHGFGHTEFGARTHYIDGKPALRIEGTEVGINHNLLGLLDPKRKGRFSLNDWLVGTCARQALPANIYKI
ncbi:molybdopterin-dependent oxidoreductase [Campylobacter sp. CCUG 57310]|uniref:molybdopterin-dependent oxidoreductase n=1 Tax=Campylobacter sp. CCUG 57310 TaxID=2517362 RepID=UPI0015649219|nr:molybdopterin-dependent oxidoreductase [Campylobacter sp. CCUG 57310]QKF92240.1 tetrathionate reductase TtrDE, catalytic subunit D [Campylobacter sp. CCUG 57310]